jgi:flagella basal body P-ring formation protein FlgA
MMGSAAVAAGSAPPASPPAAQPGGATQSLAAVARRAEQAVRDALPVAPVDAANAPRHRIVAREPDPRLRLPACPGRLEAVLPMAAQGLRARTVVQVSCAAPQARWTVLVPVALETEATVLVAARRLLRGQRPGAGDLQVVSRTLPGIASLYISNLNEIRAQHLLRPLDAGQPLTRDALAADPVIRRGEAVTLLADVGGIEVRMPGRALADAGPGEILRAQNVNSLKIVEGRADEEGRVRVDR